VLFRSIGEIIRLKKKQKMLKYHRFAQKHDFPRIFFNVQGKKFEHKIMVNHCWMD
jgi:hypothetical protein